MTIGIVGKKRGMTRIFTDEGNSIPVSVIEIEDNRVSQVKSVASDGYSAVQFAVGTKRTNLLSKAQIGHFAKAGIEAGRKVIEFKVAEGDAPDIGSSLGVDHFNEGQLVDVTGTSKGKGFAGTIKRWNFRGQDNTHGNSISHRVPGSIGQCQTPGRVFKGKKMSGHMGNERVTVQSLQIIRVDAERKLLLIKGAIPGATGGDVIVRPAVKAIKVRGLYAT